MADPNLWQPACSPAALRARARLLAAIRRFFADRDVLEVETPLLCRRGVTDPHLDPFIALYRPAGRPEEPFYLQTSPEFAMKRLLAAGSGSLFQICKAFRNGEAGRYHNPEFSLLEWYRLDFSLTDLMDEVEALIATLFCGRLAPAERHAYGEVFHHHLGLNPYSATIADFSASAHSRGLMDADRLCGDDRALWLDFLFGTIVQPHLGQGRLSFVHDYPALMPSLARRKPGQPDVVERVEVFLEGVELGNGFRELADPDEQATRFGENLAAREVADLPPIKSDERLLAALRHGLPDCSGIAIGVDRLLMLREGERAIEAVLAFPWERA